MVQEDTGIDLANLRMNKLLTATAPETRISIDTDRYSR